MTRIAVLFYSVLSLGALAWAGFIEQRWVWDMPSGQPARCPMFVRHGLWVHNLVWACVGLVGGLLLAGLSRLASGKVRVLDGMEEGFCDLIGPIGWSQALAMAAASAIGEEFVFRGIALPAVGLWWSSLIFGLVHFPMDRRFLVWPLFAGAVGLVLGALVLASGNLGPAVCLHFSVNFFNLLALGRRASHLTPVVVDRLGRLGPVSDVHGCESAPHVLPGGAQHSVDATFRSTVKKSGPDTIVSGGDSKDRDLSRDGDDMEPTE